MPLEGLRLEPDRAPVGVSEPRFSDTVAVVTGAASGIGKETVERLAAEGADVAVVDRVGDRAREVADGIAARGTRAIAVEADVTVAADVDRLVSTAEHDLGRIDLLVNNAAVAVGDELITIDEDTWDLDVETCLKSVFLCSKRALPGMIERRRGVIVNIASVNAFGHFGNDAYSAAKAGVISLTKAIAVRYGRFGIRANVIAPGTIRTPAWQKRLALDPHVFERLTKWYPLGRVGEPEDVAHAVLFLASVEAAWVTGTVLVVDGGLMAGSDVVTREIPQERRDAV